MRTMGLKTTLKKRQHCNTPQHIRGIMFFFLPRRFWPLDILSYLGKRAPVHCNILCCFLSQQLCSTLSLSNRVYEWTMVTLCIQGE